MGIVLIIRVIAIIIRLVHVINKAKVSEKNRKEMGNIDMGDYNDGGTDEYGSDQIENNSEYNEQVHSKSQSYDNGKSIEALNDNDQNPEKNSNQITTITNLQKNYKRKDS